METLNNLFLSADKIATNDYVGFTFFITSIAMLAATVFFFLEISATFFFKKSFKGFVTYAISGTSYKSTFINFINHFRVFQFYNVFI